MATCLQTFWQTWPARVLHLIPFPSGRTGAWISNCLFLTIWLRRNFGSLLSILVIPCALVPVCLQPGNLLPSLLPMFSPFTLRKFRTQILISFLFAGSSLRCVSKAKWLIWLVFKNPDVEKRQPGLFVVAQFSLLLRHRSVRAVASCGLFGCCEDDHAPGNKFERFRGFLELISRFEFEFGRRENYFLKDSNFWCVHVNVPWPVCTHAIPFRMLWCP